MGELAFIPVTDSTAWSQQQGVMDALVQRSADVMDIYTRDDIYDDLLLQIQYANEGREAEVALLVDLDTGQLKGYLSMTTEEWPLFGKMALINHFTKVKDVDTRGYIPLLGEYAFAAARRWGCKRVIFHSPHAARLSVKMDTIGLTQDLETPLVRNDQIGRKVKHVGFRPVWVTYCADVPEGGGNESV